MFQQRVRNCCPKFVGNEIKVSENGTSEILCPKFFASNVSFYVPFSSTPLPTLEKLRCHGLEAGYEELLQKLQVSETIFSITGGGYTYYDKENIQYLPH